MLLLMVQLQPSAARRVRACAFFSLVIFPLFFFVQATGSLGLRFTEPTVIFAIATEC
jgi:hypothetical protein